MPYRLVTLDVTPDNEINDAHSTHDVFDLGESPTVHEVCEALKRVSRMAPNHPESRVTLEEDGADYLVCTAKGRKVYLLRYEHK